MFLLQSDIFFWDLLITLTMAMTLSMGIGCLVMMRRSVLGVCGILSFCVVTYAAFIEPQRIVVTTHTVTHPSVQKNIRIVLVSDFHVGPYKGKRFVQKAVAKINDTFPDLVLIAGDFVYTQDANLTDLEPLQDIASLGTFAVLGNHDVGRYTSILGKQYSGKDRGDNIAAMLSRLGVEVLRNNHVTLTLPEQEVSVAGIDDLWTGNYDLTAALQDIPTDQFSILLSHNPSVIQQPTSLSADIIVSGHTHGGQVRLPVVGPLSSLPISLDQSYDQGVFTINNDTTLAITRGLGESSARVRFLAPPEIMVIELIPST